MKLSFTLNKWLSNALNTQVFMTTVTSTNDIKKLKKISAKQPGMFCVSLALEQQHLLNHLIRENFEWIDTYLEFNQKRLLKDAEKQTKINCRFADGADKKSIVAVGKSAFKTAHFYIGLQNNEKVAQKIKKSWLQNFFQSQQGDALIVAEDENKIVGFIQLSKEQNQWNLDILAVAEQAQKQGVAKTMLCFVNHHFGLVSTSTNLANLKAIQFYEDCYFQLKHIHHLLVFYHSTKTK